MAAEFTMKVSDALPVAPARGSGDGEWETRLREVAEKHPGKAVQVAVMSASSAYARKVKIVGTRNKPGEMSLADGDWQVVLVPEVATVKPGEMLTSFEGFEPGDEYQTGRSEVWVQYTPAKNGSKPAKNGSKPA